MNEENFFSLADDEILEKDQAITSIDIILVKDRRTGTFKVRIEVAGKFINLAEDATEEVAKAVFNRIGQSFKTTAENSLRPVIAKMGLY